ncbi:hypothetical protein [Streptomyces thermolilacinus]|uniref:Uncharacterized protein n=1 Tax=Streptomyces thermolilacinus SPC6 TaxID=1306406 RepID=A0A1D3DSJ5_9ACTN|nr:hypothetical protein [Streptomyces thermolilacinus]OEJ95291.1 hypothetical protein J116_013205 [Streptomyces thermolilacinus SPC6]
MGAARHFFRRSEVSDAQVAADIKADVESSRKAERTFKAAGQHRLAEDMRKATDEYLDEYNDLKSGRWSPKHAR